MNLLLNPPAAHPQGRLNPRSIEKVNPNHRPYSTNKKNQPSVPPSRSSLGSNNNRQASSNRQSSRGRSVPVQEIAMNLSANVFMNSTTKFVKGLDILQITNNLKSDAESQKGKKGHNRTSSLQPKGCPKQVKKSNTPDKPFFTSAFGSKGLPSQIKIDQILNPIKASLGINRKSNSSLSNSIAQHNRLRSGIRKTQSRSRSRSSSNTSRFSRQSSKRAIKFTQAASGPSQVKKNVVSVKQNPKESLKHRSKTQEAKQPERRSLPTPKQQPQQLNEASTLKQKEIKQQKTFTRKNEAMAKKPGKGRNDVNKSVNTLPDDQSLGTVSKLSPQHLETIRNESNPKKKATSEGKVNRSQQNGNLQPRPISRLGYAKKEASQNAELRASPPKDAKPLAKPVSSSDPRNRKPSPESIERPAQAETKKVQKATKPLQKKNATKEASTTLTSPRSQIAKPEMGGSAEQSFPRIWNTNTSQTESRLHVLKKSPPPEEKKPQQSYSQSSKIVSSKPSPKIVNSPKTVKSPITVNSPRNQQSVGENTNVSLQNSSTREQRAAMSKQVEPMKSQPQQQASQLSKKQIQGYKYKQPVLAVEAQDSTLKQSPKSRIVSPKNQLSKPSTLKSSLVSATSPKIAVTNGKLSGKVNPPEKQLISPPRILLSGQNILAFATVKLFHQFQQKIFALVKWHSSIRGHKAKEGTILLKSVSNLHNCLVNSLYKSGFSQLKRAWLSNSEHKKSVYDRQTARNIAVGMICHMVSNVRVSMLRLGQQTLLRQKQLWHIRQENTQIQLNKSKKIASKQEMISRISGLVTIAGSFYRNAIKPKFNKLLISAATNGSPSPKKGTTRAHPMPQKQNRSPIKDSAIDRKSLLSVRKQLQNEVSGLEGSIAKQKRSTDSEKRKLVKCLEQVKEVCRILGEDVSAKRLRGKELQRRIEEHLHHKSQPNQKEQPAQDQQLIDKLTRCYALTYKAKDWVMLQDVKELLGQYDSSNKAVKEWQALAENSRLLREIAPYEGGERVAGPSRRLLLEDQVLALRMMRSFVKERYWWQWVRLATKNFPSK